jgi:hypothetical protein
MLKTVAVLGLMDDAFGHHVSLNGFLAGRAFIC